MPRSAGDSAGCQLRAAWWLPALFDAERACDERARPAWIDAVEHTVAAAVPSHLPPPTGSWQEAFAVPLRPFVAAARDRLVAGARQCLPAGHADPEPIGDMFSAVLGRQLARVAVRAMVSELATARVSGCLAGSDGRQRFDDFLRRLSAPAGLAALFEKYPVLARLLGTASLLATDAILELLTRFAADRATVIETLLGGVDPGPIVSIQPGLGDRHRRGRSVAAVSFADGRKVIYKPHDLQSYIWFCKAVDWLNHRVTGTDLRTASSVARPGYGWLEFIASKPLTRPAEAELFYRREGVLLAALYAAQATDIHYENLIAGGDQPVLVDLETLFQPALPVRLAAADPAAETLAASIYRTALLPSAFVGQAGVIDQSGMGGDPGEFGPDPVLDWDPPATDQTQLIWRAVPFAGARNRPHYDGQTMEPADYEAAVLEGFRLGYDAILCDRPAFTRLIESCGDIEVRIVIRPTRDYAWLLDESTQARLLRSAPIRQEAVDAALKAPARYPLVDRLIRHELFDLWAGDIPLMTSRPTARDIWTSAGRRVRGVLGEAGLSCALARIAAMGETDRRDQEWVISACLATRRPAGGHRSTRSTPDALTPVVAEPGRLLAAASGLADEIMARGKTGRDVTDPHRVNWLGLQLVDDTRWLVLPMGAALSDGYLGVALFLTQLADLTGIGRYAEEARRAVSPLPQLLGRLEGRSDLLGAIGCGGIRGLGGISYGLARMATLLDDNELREWTQTAVQVTARAADLPGPAGWAAGSAGCLAAMTAVHAELGSAAATAVARVCADRLTELVERTDGRCGQDNNPVPPGFAAGTAGIGWALTRFGAAQRDPRYPAAGRRAILRAGEPAAVADRERSYGWCSGAAGVLIAHSCQVNDTDTAGRPSAIQILTERPLLCDLSLCHGELGVTEALAVLAAGSPSTAAHQARRHRAGLILDAMSRPARYCGTPGGLSTPGLLSGLAGIGYGLLRLGFADRVPSVLLLEPTPRSPLPSQPF